MNKTNEPASREDWRNGALLLLLIVVIALALGAIFTTTSTKQQRPARDPLPEKAVGSQVKPKLKATDPAAIVIMANDVNERSKRDKNVEHDQVRKRPSTPQKKEPLAPSDDDDTSDEP